jgi:hypothetical protein
MNKAHMKMKKSDFNRQKIKKSIGDVAMKLFTRNIHN